MQLWDTLLQGSSPPASYQLLNAHHFPRYHPQFCLLVAIWQKYMFGIRSDFITYRCVTLGTYHVTLLSLNLLISKTGCWIKWIICNLKHNMDTLWTLFPCFFFSYTVLCLALSWAHRPEMNQTISLSTWGWDFPLLYPGWVIPHSKVAKGLGQSQRSGK